MTLLLPAWTPFGAGRQNPPQRRKVLATFIQQVGENLPVEFKIVSNWPGTMWWIYAIRGGHRASNMLTTRSAATAKKWIKSVKACEVAVAHRCPCPRCNAPMRPCTTGEPDVHCSKCGEVLPL